MIHILVGDAAVQQLRAAFELDENLRGEILVLKDTLGIGPIATDQHSHDEIRTAFWQSIAGECAEVVQDKANIDNIITKAKQEEEPVCFWLAPCVSDVCAYYFLLDCFRGQPGMLHVINIDSLPFLNEKGAMFYPKNFSEVPPKEFIKTKRLLKEVSAADYETEGDTWEKLQFENAMVRVFKGGKELVNADETFFDNDIYYAISKEWHRGSKIIRTALQRSNQAVSELYLYHRLKQMVSNGQILCEEEDPKDAAKANYKKPGGSEDEVAGESQSTSDQE